MKKLATGGTAKHSRRINEHFVRSAQLSFCGLVVKDHNYTQKPLQAICPHPKVRSLFQCFRIFFHLANAIGSLPISHSVTTTGVEDLTPRAALVTILCSFSWSPVLKIPTERTKCWRETKLVVWMTSKQSSSWKTGISLWLTQIWTMIFTTSFPDEWWVSIITPILEKGDSQDCSNYRGLTVRTALSKLYAIVLNNRLMEWTEKHKLRAIAQAGFRKHYRYSESVFIFRTLIEQACAHK